MNSPPGCADLNVTSYEALLAENGLTLGSIFRWHWGKLNSVKGGKGSSDKIYSPSSPLCIFLFLYFGVVNVKICLKFVTGLLFPRRGSSDFTLSWCKSVSYLIYGIKSFLSSCTKQIVILRNFMTNLVKREWLNLNFLSFFANFALAGQDLVLSSIKFFGY